MKNSTIVVIGAIIGIMFGLVISYMAYNYFMNTHYYDVEVILKEAAKKQHASTGAFGTEEIIYTHKQLFASGLVDEMYVGDDLCNGYVTVSKDNDYYIYKPYITCGSYRTKGYQHGNI